MTLAQLSETEKICNDFISANYPVYASDVPLSEAKQIRGLRAVFGEVYPDPVRVISVRYPITDLLKSPNDEQWESTTVEFCGGTHVAKTGDIQNFVILEESSIAKGIRRIIAVTGDEAYQASRLSDEFEKKLTSARKSGTESSLKSLKIEVDQIQISTVKKQKFKDEIMNMSKELADSMKAQQATQLKDAIERVNSLLETDAASKYLITKFTDADSKLLQGVMNHLKTKAPKPILLISSLNGRVFHQCSVPKSEVSKMSANDWAGIVADKVGGKKGGKDDNAQGSGTEVSAIDSALKAAESFAKMKLST